MNPWGLAFVVIGMFSIAGGACNWDWFMNHHRARMICSILSRGGARVFYVVLGVAFVVFGALWRRA